MLKRLRHSAGAHGDAGVSLIELMVAIVLFGLLSTATLTTLNFAINLTRQDRNRVAASTLAERELEVTRNQFFSKLQGPKTVEANLVVNPNPIPTSQATGQPSIVDGVRYTVTREAEWQTPTGIGSSSPCDNGGTAELSYLHVSVTVTWARMGSVRPVTTDTLLTPTKGVYADAAGHIGVKVVDRDSKPVAGQRVYVNGVAGQATTGFSDFSDTASDGCAIFAFLTPGPYAVTMTLAAGAYVDQAGAATPSYPATVTTGSISKVAVGWDRAAAMNAAVSAPVGAAVPDFPVTLVNAGLPQGTVSIAGSGLARTLPNLWPYASGYEAYMGQCADADPQFASYTGGDRVGPVTTNPGGTAAATLQLFPMTVSKNVGNHQNKPVTATHAPDAKCASSVPVSLGGTNGSGYLLSSLPYGTWSIQVGTNSPQTVTITPSSPSGSYT